MEGGPSKKTTPLENQAKENIPADTSLSSWLVESEFTPKSKNSSDAVGNSPAEKENSYVTCKGELVGWFLIGFFFFFLNNFLEV